MNHCKSVLSSFDKPKTEINMPWLHRDPATEVELDYAEEALGFKIPDSLRVIYRLHNGQRSFTSPGHGLFGG